MSNATRLEDPTAYLARMRRLVGGRDPLEVLAETPGLLAEIVRSHTARQIRSRPFDGKWTPNEILGHLVDVEWVYGFRLRHALCDLDPEVEGFDQERWVVRQGHNDIDPAVHVESFALLRPYNLDAWRMVSPDELHRTYRHQEYGEESIATLRLLHAGHDLAHLDQLTRYLDAITTGT